MIKLRKVEWVRREVFDNEATDERIYRWAREGLLPHVRLGRKIYFDEDALRQWSTLYADGCFVDLSAIPGWLTNG